MLDITIFNILKNIWPMILIFTVILSSIRIVYLWMNHEPFILYKELITLGFVIYVMCLFHVVTFQDVSWSSSNFVPFKEMFRYRIFSTMFFRNVAGNLFMFLPYGFFISYFLKLNKKSIILFLSLIVSCTIESTQFLIGRVFDVDDIMLNVLGGLLGYYLYRLIDYIKGKLPNFLKNQIFYNVIAITVLCVILVYLYQVLEVGII